MGLSVVQRLSQCALWSNTMKAPKRIELNLHEVDALLNRVRNGSLKDSDYEIIRAMAETIHLLSQAVMRRPRL